MALTFELEEEDDDYWRDLPEAAIEGIKTALADIEAGRTYSHEYVMSEMNKQINEFRKNNGR